MPDPLKLQATKPMVTVVSPDRLQHFANDSPGWRLSALLIERLDKILYAIGLVALAALLWWSRLH